MIIAGEASGDLHGSRLINELKLLNPSIQIFGIGGDEMIKSGMEPEFHIKDMAFLGFSEVLKHLPFIRKVRKTLINIIHDEKIDTIVLIDYPGFNLNFAAKIKSANRKIIYYVSPQIWAWGNKRIKKIKYLIDKMLVVFPFEKTMYESAGVNVEYVGHPLIERINSFSYLSKNELFAGYNLDESKEILLIMPGSRVQEIERIFPEVIKAADSISEEFNLQTVVVIPPNISEDIFNGFIKSYSFTLVKEETYNLLKYAKFGIIKSGTSTLEAALHTLPFIIVYNTSKFTYYIGKSLIRIKNIGLVNIVAGKKIIEELIQDDLNKDNIVQKSRSILSNEDNYNKIKFNLSKIADLLSGPDASGKAAEIIHSEMNELKIN